MPTATSNSSSHPPAGGRLRLGTTKPANAGRTVGRFPDYEYLQRRQSSNPNGAIAVTVTKYLSDDVTDTVVMEKDETGATQAVYHSDPVQYGRLFSMTRDGETRNYRFDGNGNTRALTNSTGLITDTYRYSAFGQQRAQTGTTENPYRFGGQVGYQYNEQTQDYYVRERVYEPKRGRWASKDKLPDVLESSDGQNIYVYVQNRPASKIDPGGLLTQSVDSWTWATCGGHCLGTKWKPGPKEKDGWIIQKVSTVQKVGTCNSLSPNTFIIHPCAKGRSTTTHYYEVWRVKGGDVYSDLDGKTKRDDDFFSLGRRPGFWGSQRKTGKAVFVSMKKWKKGSFPQVEIDPRIAGPLFAFCAKDVAKMDKDKQMEFLEMFQKADSYKTTNVEWSCCPAGSAARRAKKPTRGPHYAISTSLKKVLQEINKMRRKPPNAAKGKCDPRAGAKTTETTMTPTGFMPCTHSL